MTQVTESEIIRIRDSGKRLLVELMLNGSALVQRERPFIEEAVRKCNAALAAKTDREWQRLAKEAYEYMRQQRERFNNPASEEPKHG